MRTSRMKIFFTAVIALLLLPACSLAETLGNTTYTGVTSSGSGSYWVAQSFTPQRSGTLGSIMFRIADGVNKSSFLSLYKNEGVGGTTLIDTRDLGELADDNTHTINLSSLNIQLQAGTVYTFKLDDDKALDNNNYYYKNSNVYAGGQMYDKDGSLPNYDLYFQVSYTPLINAGPDTGGVLNLNENSVGNWNFDASKAVTWSVSGSDAAVFQINSSGVLRFKNAPDYEVDKHDYALNVNATYGGVTDTRALSISVADVNEAPIITENAPTTVNGGEAYSYTLSAGDPENETLLWSVQNGSTLPNWLTLSGNILHGTPQDTDAGIYPVALSVSDGTHSVNHSDFNITVLRSAPQITSIPVTEVLKNSAYYYELTAVDDQNDTLTWSETDGTSFPEWLSFIPNGAVIAIGGTPTDAGYYDVNLSVSDGVHVTGQNFRIWVYQEEPRITSTPQTLGNTGELYTYTATAVDDQNDSLLWSIASGSTLPDWLTLTPGADGSVQLSGTPENSGVFDVNLSVSDGVHTVAHDFQIEIRESSPVVTSTPVTAVTAGMPYSYTAMAIDYQNETLHWDASTLPDWLNMKEGWYVGTIAGTGYANYIDAQGLSAAFNDPTGIVVDSKGNIFISDTGNHRIRKMDANGNVTTFAGSGTVGSDDGIGTSASFNYPRRIAIDAHDNIFVADRFNNKIRKIDPQANVTTLAGNGVASSVDGPGASATFNYPMGVAVDAAGNVYVADTGSHTIRKIDTNANVTTFAGKRSKSGSADGVGTEAMFYTPTDIAIDKAGNLYVADYNNNLIRKIDENATVTTLAGGTANGWVDASGASARFYNPAGLIVDGSGTLYVADRGNHRIRKVDAEGNVTTIAGGSGSGNIDGIGEGATLWYPEGIAMDHKGALIVTNSGSHHIRHLGYGAFLSGTPAQSGSFDVNLSVSDGGNITGHTFQITVSGTSSSSLSSSLSSQSSSETLSSSSSSGTFSSQSSSTTATSSTPSGQSSSETLSSSSSSGTFSSQSSSSTTTSSAASGQSSSETLSSSSSSGTFSSQSSSSTTTSSAASGQSSSETLSSSSSSGTFSSQSSSSTTTSSAASNQSSSETLSSSSSSGTVSSANASSSSSVDTDYDNDGISDSDEGMNEVPPRDTDGDGIPDYKDPDSDNDGTPDVDEDPQSAVDSNSTGTKDTDEDGIYDPVDVDDDGDTISDDDEGNGVVDTDNDGIPDSKDSDDDNDGIPDSAEYDKNSDGIPDDSDNDGIPDYLDYDPMGYFYDSATGEIIPGGSVSVTCTPAQAIVMVKNGSDGQYQWYISGLAQSVTCNMTVALPTGYALESGCAPQSGALDPTGAADPYLLGSTQNGSSGVLFSAACGDNPWYLDFALEPGDPQIFSNNIPLRKNPLLSVPLLHPFGALLLAALLGWFGYRRLND